jgi:DNA-binding transcriptional regulator GbsR (MarR family)
LSKLTARSRGTKSSTERGNAVDSVGRSATTGFAESVPGVQRDAAVTIFEREVVSFFIDAAEVLGVPKSVAAIYGICFASPEPLGFSEIDERLEISSGSISQGLRVLREVGALKVATGPEEKRDRFEPDLALRKLVLHLIEERLVKQLQAGKTRLQKIKLLIPGADTRALATRSLSPAARVNGARALEARIKALQTWNDKTRALLPVMKTFLKLT